MKLDVKAILGTIAVVLLLPLLLGRIAISDLISGIGSSNDSVPSQGLDTSGTNQNANDSSSSQNFDASGNNQNAEVSSLASLRNAGRHLQRSPQPTPTIPPINPSPTPVPGGW